MKTVTTKASVPTVWTSMIFASVVTSTHAFNTPASSTIVLRPFTALNAAPKRLDSNVDGPLYVNDRCINCSACSMFAPLIFERSDKESAHVVYHQPQTEEEIETARAALSACPVAAIRVETQAQRNHRKQSPMSHEDQALGKELAMSPKLNGREMPFPRPVSTLFNETVYFMGHHNEKSFGATPYLFRLSSGQWIMVDTPRFGKPAVEALESVTAGRPPDYLILTHVDDTAGHYDWKNHYPNLQRIFHTGDLGRHNWIGDTSLESVEVLLQETTNIQDGTAALQAFDLNGSSIDRNKIGEEEVVILHTPGHSPGSISILFQPKGAGNNENSSKGVLFSGDTYSYRLSSDAMTGFPRYGNNQRLQANILKSLVHDWGSEWDLLAPGHGHVRDYSVMAATKQERLEIQKTELIPAVEELQRYATLKRW
ncbi:Zn-dependent hydrolase, glyoxylase [Nitzschia inconspicua]|uniref:Zn-dependent hydrolase, glyoxylase n=1 Tax=Nitzschia inconspicua TaxID=303405 RepID=A0A9K3KGW8_9STRA|nr:Zn-dependent hydrolase, glyoxylase [Nitzschia inconspicua]